MILRFPMTYKYIMIMWHIYTIEYYVVVRNIEIMQFTKTQLEMEENMLNEARRINTE